MVRNAIPGDECGHAECVAYAVGVTEIEGSKDQFRIEMMIGGQRFLMAFSADREEATWYGKQLSDSLFKLVQMDGKGSAVTSVEIK